VTDAPVGSAADEPGNGTTYGRLIAWCGFVAALAALGYAARFADAGGPANDVLFKWSTAIGGAIQYLFMAAVAIAIGRPLGRIAVGLRRPASWGRACALVVGSLVAVLVAGGILGRFLKAGEEQGLVPDGWDGTRAAPFVANFVVVALLAPLVEEYVFRGVGHSLISSVWGPVVAVVATGLAFGLAHGLVVALPVLSLFGAILGWLRWKTDSLYPPMILHGIFNAGALIAAVTVSAS
jgi:membrane protease YdiL (CAAX protease family)